MKAYLTKCALEAHDVKKNERVRVKAGGIIHLKADDDATKALLESRDIVPVKDDEAQATPKAAPAQAAARAAGNAAS